MKYRRSLSVCVVNFIAMLSVSTASSAADSSESFFVHNSLTLLVAADAGGGYDIYARAVAPFLKRHIPGHPDVIVQDMPGAGGVRMANYLAFNAKKDGSVVGMTLSSMLLSQLTMPEQARYNAARFAWIGTIESQTNVLAIWASSSEVKSFEDAKKKEIVIGATAPDSFLYQEPALMNAIFGTKFKIVTGYKGVHDLNLAMERGEISGQVSPWSTWQGDHGDWLKSKAVIPLISSGVIDEGLASVPRLFDLAITQEQRSLVSLLEMGSFLGRSIAAPDGTPLDTVRVLRQAMADVMADTDFVEQMQSHGLPLSFRNGQDLQAYVDHALQVPPEVILKFGKILERR